MERTAETRQASKSTFVCILAEDAGSPDLGGWQWSRGKTVTLAESVKGEITGVMDQLCDVKNNRKQ